MMNKRCRDSLFDDLKGRCAAEWNQYCQHDFVNRIGDGTLPIECFRYYLEQDYIFLIHFSRAWALAAYKSSSIEEMAWAAEILHSTLHTEMNLHVEFSDRFGVTAIGLESAVEAKDNLAYTRFAIDCGQRGDLLDLYCALMPCVVGYAQIGKQLADKHAPRLPDNPYREWIEMYSGDEYQNLANESIQRFAQIGQRRGGRDRIAELTAIFRQATILEQEFWSMCYRP